MLADKSWKVRICTLIVGGILPFGLFCLLTGLLWVGEGGRYHKVFLWLIAFPTLILLLVNHDTFRSIIRSPVLAVYLIFAGYILLSLFWASPEDSVGSLVRRPFLVLILFVAINEVGHRNPDLLRRVVYLSALGGLLGALYFLGRFLLEGASGRLFGYGALYNPLLVSHVFGFFAALWIGRYFSEERMFSPVSLFAIIGCGALLLATGSRTPLVALVASVLWVSVLVPNRKSFYCLGGFFLILALAVVFWPEILTQRGASYRPEIWSDALRQIAERPWFGHGFDTPMIIQLADIPYPFHEPHNLTLSVIYDLGAIGGGLWLLLYGVALAGAWRYRKSADVIWFSVPVVYGLFAGMTEGGSFLSRPKEHWFLVWIPLALLAVVISQIRWRSRGLE
jgi:O-antigen ligase